MEGVSLAVFLQENLPRGAPIYGNSFHKPSEQSQRRRRRTRAGAPPSMETTLMKVMRALVLLDTSKPHSFDTDTNGRRRAAGFVVDKSRGILLTTRCAVGVGPMVGEATFISGNEVSAQAIYQDPVHNFSFLCFDTSAITSWPCDEIPLAPEAASVGLETWVVGNVTPGGPSIEACNISRLDAEAPAYADEKYEDFNTFYLQAASAGKGATTGSPAIDSQGRAVAVYTTGRRDTSIVYYLPLDRVVRALNLVKNWWRGGQWKAIAIPRGTLQTTFRYIQLEEASRLGLQRQTDKTIREMTPADQTGVLVVQSTVPAGPADRLLEVGDILVHIDGKLVTQFLNLESVLDDSVGQSVEIEVERLGFRMTFKLKVHDLHEITPSSFLEINGAILHPLSYQLARIFNQPCRSIYVAQPGYILTRAKIPENAIIKKFAGMEIASLWDVYRIMNNLGPGGKAYIEFVYPWNRYRTLSALITMDQHDWYGPAQVFTRENNGRWLCKLAKDEWSQCLSTAVTPTPTMAASTSSRPCNLSNLQSMWDSRFIIPSFLYRFIGMVIQHFQSRQLEVQTFPRRDEQGWVNFKPYGKPSAIVEDELACSLVQVEVYAPDSCPIDCMDTPWTVATGIVIHHSEKLGLIAVDRSTVYTSAADIVLSFATVPVEVPGHLVFMHPVHNLALVAYKPPSLKALWKADIRSAELPPRSGLHPGETVSLISLDKQLKVKAITTTVTNPIVPLEMKSPDPPQYMPMNMDVIELDVDPGNGTNGVLVDRKGRVQALWARFGAQNNHIMAGIPIHFIKQVLERIITHPGSRMLLFGEEFLSVPHTKMLEVELEGTPLNEACEIGLPSDWVEALSKKDPLRQQVLRVTHPLAGSTTHNFLKQGDMVLSIDNKLITCFQDVDDACQCVSSTQCNGNKITMTVFRQNHLIDLYFPVDIRGGFGTTRFVHWCGCILQKPHPAVRKLGYLPEGGHGVYVSKQFPGSPVARCGIKPLQWILEIDGRGTENLSALLKIVKDIEPTRSFRVKVVSSGEAPKIVYVKQQLNYWPTLEMKFDPNKGKWQRSVIKGVINGSL